MRRWAFLLNPGWLVLGAVVLTFAYLCFAVLAPWQLGKNTANSRENSQLQRALTAEPVPLTTLLPQQDSTARDDQWRKVSATGHYLPDAQVVVRLRVVESEPAFEVLVPFVVDGGPTVLVNRGFVRPEQASRIPPIARAPESTVSIIGRLHDPQPPIPGKDPFSENGVRQVYTIDTAQVAELIHVPLTESYLQLVDDQPGGLGVIGLPHLDSGPFLSYGIQWIAFGILAPLGLAYFLYTEIRVRRQGAESADTGAKGAGTAGDDPGDGATGDGATSDKATGDATGGGVPPIPPRPRTREEKLADRYGRRR